MFHIVLSSFSLSLSVSLPADSDLIETFLSKRCPKRWQLPLCKPLENEIKYACDFLFFLLFLYDDFNWCLRREGGKRKKKGAWWLMIAQSRKWGVCVLLLLCLSDTFIMMIMNAVETRGFTEAIQTLYACVYFQRRVCWVCQLSCLKTDSGW